MAPTTEEKSEFFREEIDAAVRATPEVETPDTRGLAVAVEAAERIVSEFPEATIRTEMFRGEITVVIEPENLVEIATFCRDSLEFIMFSDISPCDWLEEKEKRFSVQYLVRKMEPGAPTLRLQVWVDEGESLPSLIYVYPTVDWHEREAWDFFGIEFTGRQGMRRLIMADDWVGHPLRKDYPIGGEPVKFTNSLREVF